MRHFASSRFWACFESLPTEVQRLALRNYALLKQNPTHPSLQFKPICSGKFRSVRVGLHYRALGVPVEEGVQWFWIGSHADYDRLIG
ncbi:hypothetical protein [Methylogaea oryzae]|uniref:ParE family toxin-like protein n=1 Tax=Methylogaea oryzae TaxID=1295382 RepID=UPI0009ECAC51|nr:hypothetical protein [Methylogaea oryzae]